MSALLSELEAVERRLLAESRPMLAYVVQDARERIAELEREIADLKEGRAAVLPKTREHARKLLLVADACLNGNALIQPLAE